MAKLLQLRRGTTSQHSSFTGAVGEVTVDTDKDTAVVHDGSTAGGFPLAANASPTFTGSHIGIPSVTTANLPGASGGTNASQTATNGMLVYNSTLGIMQQRAGGVWSGITILVPIITGFEYSDGAAATAEKTVVGLVSVSCTTQTSTTVLVPGASLGIQVGMVVAGTGIPVGATVVSVIEDTSFVLSAAATASATVTLTFGGAVTITGTNFDSILGGSVANVAVTFDGTSATSISVNSIKTIITCTPPAHAAGTITLLVTNGDGQSASTDFIYDEEAIFTTAAGSLGSFLDATYTANADAPRIQGTENSVALTTGFQRVTSAFDDTVITTTIQGLTVLTSGYLTGTLSATEGTTYPFYATAKDSQNQRTAPRLFNIISLHPITGGNTINTDDWVSGYKFHVFTADGSLTVNVAKDVAILVVGGGGSGGAYYAGGGGAGGLVYDAVYAVTANTYDMVIGNGGAASTGGTGSGTIGVTGGDTTVTINSGSSLQFTAKGGGGGGFETTNALEGGSGGGTGYLGTYGATTQAGTSQHGGVDVNIGYIGAGGSGTSGYNGGGGGGAGGAGVAGSSSGSGAGGLGYNASAIFGTAVGEGGFFASGGGGGWTVNSPGLAGGISQPGGGGAGATDVADGEAGQANTGGGSGGGGQKAGYEQSGIGGSGIVIVRYAI